MATRKQWERFSTESLINGDADNKGSLFISELGQIDLVDVNLLRAGVDTVRQLYSGVCQFDVFDYVKDKYEGGFKEIIELGGIQWLLGSGGASGYRYRLQNSALGLILFFGSRYAESDKDGAHLKIEVSPHHIDRRSVNEIQGQLDQLALFLIEYPTPTGVAVHVALDVQGWEPPSDFERRLVCRSKRKVTYEGLESVEFDSLSQVSAIYGDRETFLFGTASALQFTLYRKDIEIRKRDKMHFWHDVWDKSTGGELSPETAFKHHLPVWRFELRFHHSVIQEFGLGIDEKLLTFKQVSQHLTGLWRKGLDSYRLDKTRTYIDPFWQMISDDVEVYQPAKALLYKRAKKQPGFGNEKNVLLALGNLLSIYARNKFTTHQAYQYLKASGIWEDLTAYWYVRMNGIDQIYEFIDKALNLRRLQGIAA